MAKANASSNGATVEFHSSINSVSAEVKFDLILCNPASLPSKGGLEPFFSSGVLGNDMIFEALNIALQKLTPNGEMRLVHTSLVPLHITQARLNELQLHHQFLDLRELEFRNHYTQLEPHFQAIRTRHGIQYLERGSKKSELLYLVRISKS